MSVNICLIYLGVPILGAHMFTNIIFSSCIDPCIIKHAFLGFPGGAVVGNLPANAGDTGLIPGPGRSHMLQSN